MHLWHLPGTTVAPEKFNTCCNNNTVDAKVPSALWHSVLFPKNGGQWSPWQHVPPKRRYISTRPQCYISHSCHDRLQFNNDYELCNYEEKSKIQQDRQCTCNVILRRVHETTVAVESNKFYIFLCMCVRARVGETMRMHACVRVCVYVWVGEGARARACACARVGLLIQYTMHRRHIVCVLSGFTILFDIIP